jgi:hypothetical protein
MDVLRTPTVFHLSAQGCAPRATLGAPGEKAITLKGFNSSATDAMNSTPSGLAHIFN